MAIKLADMDLFSIVEEGKAIIRDRGVYLQVELYKRGEQLFAAYGKGFVRLLGRNNTTVPHVRWEAIEGIRYEEEFDGPKDRSPAAGGLKAAE